MQLDPQILEIISIIIAIISIIIAFIIGTRSIRNYSISRKADVFINYQNQAYDKEFILDRIEIYYKWSWKNYEDFTQKYGPLTNPEAYAKFISVVGYYEGLPRLLKKNIIEIDLVPEVMKIGILAFYEKFKPISKQMAEDLGQSEVFEVLDYLYYKIKLKNQKKL